MNKTAPTQGGSLAEISNGNLNLWVLFGYYCYKKIREIMKFVFCVSYSKPHNKAIFRKLLKTSKCEGLVSIPVRVTTPRSSRMPLQSRLRVFRYVRILVLVFIWPLSRGGLFVFKQAVYKLLNVFAVKFIKILMHDCGIHSCCKLFHSLKRGIAQIDFCVFLKHYALSFKLLLYLPCRHIGFGAWAGFILH